MPLKFQPKQESEIRRFSRLEPGIYPFTVMESAEVASKSAKNAGRLMVKVKLNVHGPTSDVHVYDYFADWFSEWKLKHFCESVGLGHSYNAGSVDPSDNAWEGRTGSVEIDIEPAKGEFKAKNSVVDYVVRTKPAKAEPAPEAPPADGDDEIPF